MNEGWTWLWNATKFHYFRDNRSLCGKWAVIGKQEYRQGNNDSPDNCTACRRRLEGEAKRKAREVGK